MVSRSCPIVCLPVGKDFAPSSNKIIKLSAYCNSETRLAASGKKVSDVCRLRSLRRSSLDRFRVLEPSVSGISLARFLRDAETTRRDPMSWQCEIHSEES